GRLGAEGPRGGEGGAGGRGRTRGEAGDARIPGTPAARRRDALGAGPADRPDAPVAGAGGVAGPPGLRRRDVRLVAAVRPGVGDPAGQGDRAARPLAGAAAPVPGRGAGVRGAAAGLLAGDRHDGRRRSGFVTGAADIPFATGRAGDVSPPRVTSLGGLTPP